MSDFTTQSLVMRLDLILPKDLYYFCCNDDDKSDQKWDYTDIECLTKPFHTATRSSGGHFLLKEECKENENTNQGNRTCDGCS